jgi:uncharacterized RDD family membrane protein YckC
MKPKKIRTYHAHETERSKALEGVRLASFSSRALAYGIDFLFATILYLLVAVPVAYAFQKFGGEADPHIHIDVSFEDRYSLVGLVLYFTLSLYWGKGSSPGKRLCKIRVVSLEHERISLWHCFERALGYAASALELGFFQYFFYPNCQTVHDRIAETIVIDERKRPSGD